MIWSAAAPIQFQHIADGLLQSSSDSRNPRAERRRQAFLGYDNLTPAERRPLALHVRSSLDKQKLRVVADEFQALVSCLPMGTVSHEARSHAAKFCRTKLKVMDVVYFIDEQGDEDCDTGVEILDHVFAQPTTVMVTKSHFKYRKFVDFGSLQPANYKFPELGVHFKSAEHLVDVVSRVFGSCVERIILNFWANTNSDLREIYWPHTARTKKATRKELKPTYIRDPKHDPDIVFMTPDRKMHVVEQTWEDGGFDIRDTFEHLLKIYEILDFVTTGGKLPQLQGIDLELHTLCWAEDLLTRIRSTIKDDVIWINWSDVAIEFHHKFVAPTYF
ncbi:hypothetical protein K505DRAFT_414153 [Melanomma pulvis-pyrius CBS 109.77]|uniref:Uncharacterized protein n=1 Tax=Melanomma pulvis-pyrius CBS 109.77 TaxID=1314802 RepID=A0A6A6XT55_9PLEO|nr:hypothetical protein K505DRAFT_414153 [Melanomma pulvis-pyrius CBS 109.77]